MCQQTMCRTENEMCTLFLDDIVYFYRVSLVSFICKINNCVSTAFVYTVWSMKRKAYLDNKMCSVYNMTARYTDEWCS